jgi:drug/metabolite transporter superfamily protein YnfA
VAVGACALTGALVSVGIVLAVLHPTATTIAWAALGGLVAVLSAALGVVVARHAPSNVVGALLALVGLSVAWTAAREIG